MSSHEQDTSAREVVCSRVPNFPRERAFQAWTDPRQMAQWWGPNGFTNTIQEFDPKPGNTLRYTMHAPSGAEYHNESLVEEIVAPERIVLRHLKPVHHFLMTMTFADLDGKTTLTWKMVFDTIAECSNIKDFVAQANEQNFARLEAYLTKTA